MKVLICGAGKVSIHLLRRLDKSWHVTLIEKSEKKLKNLLPEFQNVEKAIAGDASSPVTLDDARVTDFDYVLALTENDRVNLAICEYAYKQSVNQILARVNEQENQPKFQAPYFLPTKQGLQKLPVKYILRKTDKWLLNKRLKLRSSPPVQVLTEYWTDIEW